MKSGKPRRLDAEATRSLRKEFLEHVKELPDGEKVMECIQCGTCSATCPSASRMDYSPRAIVAALRAGDLEHVLESDSVWLCASCYGCTVRCPAGIPFTDMMYELKRLAMARGLLPRARQASVMAGTFAETVNRLGRNNEVALIRKYYLRTNPFAAMGQMGFALRMMKRGRLELSSHRIKGIEGLVKMLSTVEQEGAK